MSESVLFAKAAGIQRMCVGVCSTNVTQEQGKMINNEIHKT